MAVFSAAFILFFAALATAAAAPVCPNTQAHVCIFSGVTFDAIKPGPQAKDFTTASFQCPVTGGVLTGTLNQPYTNLNGDQRKRTGVEISIPEGTKVGAPAKGKVKISKPDLLGAGIHVVIEHGTNPLVETTVGYLQHADVREGDIIKNAGQTIGTSGKNPATGVPSVYFELRRDGLIQRDVEVICKSRTKTTPGPQASVAGAVDCSKFAKNAVPEPWSVIPEGLFHASRDKGARQHGGFDFGGKPIGTPVFSVWPGRVRYYKFAGGYGNEVSIKTECNDGTSRIVTYDHLDGFNKDVLSKGTVQTGETIGYVGNTGGNYDEHLHINVFGPPYRLTNGLDDGNRVNPENLIVGGLQGRVVG